MSLGPQPPWWRPFARRKWRLALRATMEAAMRKLAQDIWIAAAEHAWKQIMTSAGKPSVASKGEVN